MTMVYDQLRLGLATTHIPVSDIARKIDTSLILDRIGTINKSLSDDFDIDNPRIAVLGLNPHAGDGGIIGNEEETTIQPAISQAQSKGIDADGTFPADGFLETGRINNMTVYWPCITTRVWGLSKRFHLETESILQQACQLFEHHPTTALLLISPEKAGLIRNLSWRPCGWLPGSPVINVRNNEPYPTAGIYRPCRDI